MAGFYSKTGAEPVSPLAGFDHSLKFQENYLFVERLVKKHLPVHLWNRRVWGRELAEWNIITPSVRATKCPHQKSRP